MGLGLRARSRREPGTAMNNTISTRYESIDGSETIGTYMEPVCAEQ